MVFRRKWIILSLFVVTTVTVVAVTLTTPIKYQSVGRVLIKRGERESALLATRRVIDWKEDLASEMEVMKSVPVSTRAQALLDERARGGGHRIRFRPAQIDVQVLGQSNVVLIAYVDRDPEVAHQACDALIKAYVEQRLKNVAVSYPKEFFDDEISAVTRELNRWETQRRNFIAGSGLTDFTADRSNLLSFQMSQKAQLESMALDLAEGQAELRQMEDFSRDPDMDLPMLGKVYGNEAVAVEFKTKMMAQETRLAQLRERYRDDAPEVVSAAATLESMRAMLRREVEGRVRMVRGRVAMLEQRMAPLRRELAEVETRLARMPAQEKTINEMDREIQVLRNRYTELSTNADRVRITEQTSSNVSVAVLAPAGPPVPSNARDYVRLALAPAFSVVVGLGIAFFLDGLDSRVRTPLDVETGLDVPVLASITERRRSG